MGRRAVRSRGRRSPRRVPVHRSLRRTRLHRAPTRAGPPVGASCSPGRSTTRSACSTSGSTRPTARTPTTGTARGRWASSSHPSPPRGSCTRAGPPRARTRALRPAPAGVIGTSTGGSTASIRTVRRRTTTATSSTSSGTYRCADPVRRSPTRIGRESSASASTRPGPRRCTRRFAARVREPPLGRSGAPRGSSRSPSRR